MRAPLPSIAAGLGLGRLQAGFQRRDIGEEVLQPVLQSHLLEELLLRDGRHAEHNRAGRDAAAADLGRRQDDRVVADGDMVGDAGVIPVVYRLGVSGMSRQLRARLSGWDNVLWDLPNWYRET